ncbi:WAT1-related protein At2g39510 isoform X2 [Lactuca sativa]|uniref:WAT1-related protein At2g39510 isoform X2 n=1 Tax=Lactuca sativa TaxID=4236 RepID=UPI001C68D3FB|nr:WAT1-related protein At2g39510 isoform X2 [Lactuca sativa]
MSKESFKGLYDRTKPFMFIIFLQTSYAVGSLVIKSALNKGLNHYTFAVYRNAIATLFFGPLAFFFERKARPKMTVSIFLKIILLGLLEPVIDQNLFYAGMKSTTATFASAMCNILPAITFVMAWMLRLEKVKMKSLHSQVKIIGTLVTIGGAMIMTLIRGPEIQFPWTNNHTLHHQSPVNTMSTQDQIKGSLMISVGCISWASFVILQGVVCSGFAYYISGVVMRDRGPVFVTAFNPLSMVIISILESSFLAEKLNLGNIVGAIVIVLGLYLVIWGKSKDQKQQGHESSLNQQENGMKRPIKHSVDVVNSHGKPSSDVEVV